ncbi:unnamed protein product [Brassica napus]|uniref:(rape) hypothetical protein n=1 Tax=Brassica napus TaxID=3708 RepID=A0A817B511_BRANA|nr:unnamed protein product [Brassica napus]
MDEEREKKRRKIKRETNDDDHHRSQLDHIPVDLTLEILSRLPVKSIVRFGCVSKLWSSFITLPFFINLFASRSSLRQPSLLLTVALEKKKAINFSFPQNKNPDGSYSPLVFSCRFTNTNDWDYRRCSDSVHGLILCHGFKIWNPSLRRFFVLPPPPNEHISSWCSSYLGYDMLKGKHKVLSIHRYSLQTQVLTFGAQESWRTITKPPMHPYDSRGRCFNGVVYYRAHIDDQSIIMSFDVKSETFSPIKYPKGVCRLRCHMLPYEGKLALVKRIHPAGGFDLYILKDEDGHEWTHQRLVFEPKSESRYRISFMGVTNAGELIFTTPVFLESFYVLYFDPRRNISREALFEGLDGEIRRHGLDSGSMETLDIIPDHIESLLSM